MRFSTVVVASTAALAGSAAAFPVPGYEHDLTARNTDDVLLQLRAFFEENTPRGPGSASTPDGRPKLQRAKKLNPAEVDAALKQLKHKNSIKRSLYLEDLDSVDARGFFDEELEIDARGPASAPAVPNTPGSSSSSSSTSNLNGRPKSANAAGPNTPNTGALHRSPTVKHKSNPRLTSNGSMKKSSKKLTTTQQAQQDFATAGTDYRKAQAEFKKAEADLAAARKMRTEGLNRLGLGNMDNGMGQGVAASPQNQKSIGASKAKAVGSAKRSLDIEDGVLDALAARGFFDDLFGRGNTQSTPVTPSTPTTPGSGVTAGIPGQTIQKAKTGTTPPSNKHLATSPNTNANANHRDAKLTGKPSRKSKGSNSRTAAGQKALLTASTDYNRAQAEFKQAQKDLEAARKMRTKAMGELGLGGLDNGFGAPGTQAVTSQKSATGAGKAGSVSTTKPRSLDLGIGKREVDLDEIVELVARMMSEELD